MRCVCFVFLLCSQLLSGCDNEGKALAKVEATKEAMMNCLISQQLLGECDDPVKESQVAILECTKSGIEKSKIDASVGIGTSKVNRNPDESPFMQIKSNIEGQPFYLDIESENFLALKNPISDISGDVFRVAAYAQAGKEIRIAVVTKELIPLTAPFNTETLANFPILTKKQIAVLESSVSQKKQATGDVVADMFGGIQPVNNVMIFDNIGDLAVIDKQMTTHQVDIVSLNNSIVRPHFKIYNEKGKYVEDSFYKSYRSTGNISLQLFPGKYKIIEEESVLNRKKRKEKTFEVRIDTKLTEVRL